MNDRERDFMLFIVAVGQAITAVAAVFIALALT
jgi:hypothetical protein